MGPLVSFALPSLTLTGDNTCFVVGTSFIMALFGFSCRARVRVSFQL
jgi:hypothetical protein